jgi:hypothetical protein
MPRKPGWYTQTPAIRSQLLKLDAPTLDREAFQLLFKVQKRQANNLMRALGGYKVGTSFVVDRQALLDRLDELSAVRGVATAEIQRKVNVVERIEALRKEARTVRIPRPKPAKGNSRLPEGISIPGQGQLLIENDGPEQVLSRILALIEMANRDFAGFQEAIGGGGNGV